MSERAVILVAIKILAHGGSGTLTTYNAEQTLAHPTGLYRRFFEWLIQVKVYLF